METHSDYEAIIDAANVGLYQQNFADGGFSISQVILLEVALCIFVVSVSLYVHNYFRCTLAKL